MKWLDAAGFREILGRPKTTRRLWAVALVLNLPAVLLGYVLDDLQQQSMLRGTYDAATRTGGELYCFSPGPGRGIDPALTGWWDYPESSLCFLRPLSSWSLWVDHAWLWELPALAHLHSVLWFMGLWLAWRAVLLRYLPAHIANLALLLTAASGFVTMTTAWIAARHALVGGCFAVWGLYHCLASRDEARRPNEAVRSSVGRETLGYLLIGLGLLSSEMVLGIFGFLVAREWFTRSPGGALRRGSVPRIVAYALAGLTYVGVHAALGYGAPKYPMYLDPFGEPLVFLREVPERLLGLLGDLVLGVPSEFWLYPSALPILVPVSAFAALMVAVAVAGLFARAPDDLRHPLRWLAAGALLSLVPCVSGMQGGRSLTIAGFPLFAVLACCLLELPRSVSANAPGPPWFRGRLRSISLGTLAAGALVGNPLSHIAWYGVLAGLEEAGEASFDESAASCQPGADVYLVDASQMGASAWYARFWLKDQLGAKNFRQLTMIPAGIESIEMRRTGPSSMTLRAIGGPLVGEMAVAPGSEGRIQPGFSRDFDDYRVRVERVSEDGPVEAVFDFARALDSPLSCFFVHDDVRLYPIEPPAVGRSRRIVPESPL